jgi:hypothetical protein
VFETLYVAFLFAEDGQITHPLRPTYPDEEMIDTLKELGLQMDDFEMIKPLAKGQFGTVSSSAVF